MTVLHLLNSGWTGRWRAISFCIIGLALGSAVAILPASQLVIVTGVICAIVVIGLVLIEPALGVALMLFAAPFGPLENITLGLPIESGQALLLLTLTSWCARMVYERHMRISAGRLFWPLALFVSVGMLSFFVASSFDLWIKECVKWLEVLAVYLFVINEVKKTPRSRDIFIVAILLSTLFQSCLGIYQFGLRGTGPNEFAILGNRFYRSYSTFEQPNPFGGYMGLTWPFAFGVAYYWFQNLSNLLRVRCEKVQLYRAFAALSFALLVSVLALLALILSWSRGAWLGAGAAAIVMLFALVRRPVLTLTILGAIAALVVSFNLLELLPPSVLSRLTDFTKEFSSLDVRGVTVGAENFSLVERLAHWQAAQNMILNHPWLGVGFGNYGAAYAQYHAINWPNALGHAHNYYLNIFAETGIAGLLAYGWLWLVVLIRTISLLKRDPATLSRTLPLTACLALGLLGSWAQLSMHQLVDNLYVANIFLLIGVYFGLLSQEQQVASPQETDR